MLNIKNINKEKFIELDKERPKEKNIFKKRLTTEALNIPSHVDTANKSKQNVEIKTDVDVLAVLSKYSDNKAPDNKEPDNKEPSLSPETQTDVNDNRFKYPIDSYLTNLDNLQLKPENEYTVMVGLYAELEMCSRLSVLYLLAKMEDLQDKYIFPYFKLNNNNGVKSEVVEFLKNLNIDSDDITIKGGLTSNNLLYVFAHLNADIEVDNIYSWDTINEIANIESIYQYDIHESVSNIFKQTPFLTKVLDKNGLQIENPMVLYREIDDESTEDDILVSLSVTIEEYANEKFKLYKNIKTRRSKRMIIYLGNLLVSNDKLTGDNNYESIKYTEDGESVWESFNNFNIIDTNII